MGSNLNINIFFFQNFKGHLPPKLIACPPLSTVGLMSFPSFVSSLIGYTYFEKGLIQISFEAIKIWWRTTSKKRFSLLDYYQQDILIHYKNSKRINWKVIMEYCEVLSTGCINSL